MEGSNDVGLKPDYSDSSGAQNGRNYTEQGRLCQDKGFRDAAGELGW